MSDQPPPAPPMPVADPMTQFFWDAAKAHELRIQRCQACGTYIHPPRPVCRVCRSTDLQPEDVSGRATLYTWTVAEQAFGPYFAGKLPYVYAVVELVEQPGLHVITNVVDVPWQDLRAGMELEVAFEDVTDELTLPVFRPAR
jgi:uncharacterized OB-fold protein